MKNRSLITQKSAPYIFLAPTIIIFMLFMVYPVVRSLILSFFEFKGGKYDWMGMRNYRMLFRDKVFFQSLFNTFVYLIIQVPVMIVLAILIAVVIEHGGLHGKGFFRTCIFLPSVTALVAYALIFKVLFNSDYGLINHAIEALGGRKVAWFYEEWPARFTIIISITWRWVGYNMIILMAGIQAIPQEQMESADIAGANFWQKLFHITIPSIRPIILFCAITSTIGTLQLFDEPYILTEGGPNNATITAGEYLYNNGFQYLKYGYASAIGYVLVVIIALLSVLEFKVSKEEE